MTKQKIKIELRRKNGQTKFIFEIDPSLEAIFKGKSKEIRESESWKGLKFYYIPEMVEDAAYKNLLYDHRLIDDYGTTLYKSNGHFNVAFLRTVGGKGEIKLKNDIPFIAVSEGVKNIVSFIKKYYEDFLKDYKVRGFVDFEV